MAHANDKVITRFPPSPTGAFHVGSARTALFNFLFAQKHGGVMLLRIEDTDKDRSKREYEELIYDGLDWLGVEYTAGVRQSERTDIYKSYIEKLLESGSAYVSKEEEGERSEVIRFKNPNQDVTFIDEIRGEITFNTEELGDFVIARSTEDPLYHLAVVVDDFEMGVTHIIRGEDHISNTPRQILIQEAIGAPRPIYAHIPLILGPDKSKLSKRHGATALIDYRDMGYLPEAMLNYLALLGWHPKGDREILSREEIVMEFELKDVQKSGAIFSTEKLNDINKHYLRTLSEDEFFHKVKGYLPDEIQNLPNYSDEMLTRVLPLIRERIEKFSDIEDMANEGDLEYYFEKPGYFAESLMWKDEESLESTQTYLKDLRAMIENIADNTFNYQSIKDAVWDYATEKGRGNVLWPLRYALSGMERSPDPFQLSEILGKEETLSRIDKAMEKIDERSGQDHE